LPANPSDQYLNPIVSQQVFLRRPFAFSFFYEAGLKILPPNDTDYIKNVNNFVKIQILVPDTQFVCQNQVFFFILIFNFVYLFSRLSNIFPFSSLIMIMRKRNI